MAIDRTFDFSKAQHITEEDVEVFFTLDGEKLDALHLPATVHKTISELLNGELDHVTLRRAIEDYVNVTA